MASTALTSLIDDLQQFRLLDATQFKELSGFQARFSDPKELGKELVRRGWLTIFQAEQLLRGKGQDLLLGSYVLLDRLGEGGMGQVFKARNWKLGKIVALKLIHKERMANPTAVKRFQREVRAAAQLNHPNVVVAYDADEVGGTHLLVMEYVEGSDLADLVKKTGPLPVDQACGFIRQAALGLQHAFEKGLVHRDIKPSNLLLSKSNVVKILDMGLARLDGTSLGGDQNSSMTQDGAVMGTPDYIAPEQALDAHKVDIRGDIYALGCTLYFLLTAQVPFPGGGATEKLLKRQLEDPTPVERVRRDVPPRLAAVVRKMVARKAENRYQTPLEVAAALQALGSDGSSSGPYQDKRARAQQRRWRRVAGAGGSLVLVMFGLLLIGQRFLHQDGRPNADVADRRDTPKKVDEVWLRQVAALAPEKQWEAVVGKLKELNPDFDGKLTVPPKIEHGTVTELQFFTDNVTDISPLRALSGLKSLGCSGSLPGKGRLVDLSPLGDLKLATLNCSGTKVSDLRPLTGMKLMHLNCGDTGVSDLAPLRDGKLTYLLCPNTPVADLSPVRGMPLTNLNCSGTKVVDLSPMKDTTLTQLNCENTPVADLTALKGTNLTHLNCGGTKVVDLLPLKDMKLTFLHCNNLPVSDLSALKEMKLTTLSIWKTKVSDLTPLKGMQLTEFHCWSTPVSDLTPLKDMQLTILVCGSTKITDFALLKNMPLKIVWLDFKPERDTELLRSLTTLVKINGKSAAEFWKEVDANRKK